LNLLGDAAQIMVGHNAKQQATFQIGMWHLSKRKIAGEHRTNIHAKEAHIKVCAELVINHSSYLEVN